MEPVTVIFFSCRRLGLLRQSVDAFIDNNSYPVEDIIIVNDSGDDDIHLQLKESYSDFTLVLNKENMGLFKSIDIGYSHVKTNFVFHCEDDWMVTKGWFIEKSLCIMGGHPEIEEVWLKDYNDHPLDRTIFHGAEGVPYRLASENINVGVDGYNEGWHGFATACSLKRISDYKKVAPYSDIHYKGSWKHPITAWHKEYAIGLAYHRLGYRTAVLIDDEYAVNIGIGQSEYICGKTHKI